MSKIKTKHQGDVLLITTTKAVGKRKKVPAEGNRVVLAHGEVTGHAHALDASKCSLYLDDSTTAAPDVMPMLALAGGLPGDRLLVVEEPTPLLHEEHSPIDFKKGEKAVVRIQKQYQWGRASRTED